MKNRLCLNKKPVYVLPDEVDVAIYMNKYNDDVGFIPNICICAWGASVGRIEKYKNSAKQICVKTDNNKLLDFIKKYDWRDEAHRVATPNINMWKFKKIILEEFYNKRA